MLSSHKRGELKHVGFPYLRVSLRRCELARESVEDEAPDYTEVDEVRKANRRLFGLLALVLAIFAFFFRAMIYAVTTVVWEKARGWSSRNCGVRMTSPVCSLMTCGRHQQVGRRPAARSMRSSWQAEYTASIKGAALESTCCSVGSSATTRSLRGPFWRKIQTSIDRLGCFTDS